MNDPRPVFGLQIQLSSVARRTIRTSVILPLTSVITKVQTLDYNVVEDALVPPHCGAAALTQAISYQRSMQSIARAVLRHGALLSTAQYNATVLTECAINLSCLPHTEDL